MQYLVNITSTFHVAQTNTSWPTRTHSLWNEDVQTIEGTTRTHGSIAHVSALGFAFLVYQVLQYTATDGCGGQTRAREENWMNPRTCTPGTCYKKRSSTTKWPCSSLPMFLVNNSMDNNKSSVYTFEKKCCWHPKDSLSYGVSACKNITSLMNLLIYQGSAFVNMIRT